MRVGMEIVGRKYVGLSEIDFTNNKILELEDQIKVTPYRTRLTCVGPQVFPLLVGIPRALRARSRLHGEAIEHSTRGYCGVSPGHQ